MDTLIGIAVAGVWIAISVVALKRAYGSRPSRPAGSVSDTGECLRLKTVGGNIGLCDKA
jgi:hypothetical protein